MALFAAFKGMKGLGLSSGIALGLIAVVLVINRSKNADTSAA